MWMVTLQNAPSTTWWDEQTNFSYYYVKSTDSTLSDDINIIQIGPQIPEIEPFEND